MNKCDEFIPAWLVRHACVPGAVPAGGGDVGESERLRAALTWAYEYDLGIHHPAPALVNSVYYEPPGTDAPAVLSQFEVTEDVLGIERTALFRHARGVSLEAVEAAPMRLGFQGELAYKLLEAVPEQRCVRYSGEFEGIQEANWRVRVGGLSVLRHPTAVAAVSCGGLKPLSFSEPVAARTDAADDEFRVDLLGSAGGGGRALRDHLTDLFGLFGADAQHFDVSVHCDYAHRLDGAGVEVTVPVVEWRALPYDPHLPESFAAGLKGWHEAARPPAGRFIFRLQLHQRRETQAAPAVDLGRLVLPSESIADL